MSVSSPLDYSKRYEKHLDAIKRKFIYKYIKPIEAFNKFIEISKKEIYEKLYLLKDIKFDFPVKKFGIDAYLIESNNG